ncbi:MAG: FGGY family carbohydrate kinase [Sphaerochaeta sp.]
MKKIALGIDVGTTGIKSVLADEEGKILAFETAEQNQFFPRPGWCEQDGEEILELCLKSYRTLLAKTKLSPKDISCIGLDHQGESCLVWDRKTGKCVYPVITWQDRRMADASEEFGRRCGDRLQKVSGLRSDSYYSAWKIRWILDNIADGQMKAEEGQLLAGTLNTWLFWNFSKNRTFVTDESSADVMMLCDPRVTGWNEWLLSEINIPRKMLPEILPCNSVLAVTDPDIFGAEIPVTCSLADCSAGIIASGAMNEGDMTVTYGTGNFLHLITGDRFVVPYNGLTSSCSFALSDNRKVFQLNGICYTAGSAVKWLKNSLGLISSASETQALAESVTDSGGVFFVPAMNGLATPYWDQSARGAFMGITGGTSKAHIVRSVLESSAFQVANCSRIIENVSGIGINGINAMGGITSNSFLMQLQADLCGLPVKLPVQTEPCYGAACMALSGIGSALTADSLKGLNPPEHVYYPKMSEKERKTRIDEWLRAVERTLFRGKKEV